MQAARVPVDVFQKCVQDRSLEADVRQALILSLGNYPRSAVSPDKRSRIDRMLQEVFQTDPDAGVHAAAKRVLDRWNLSAQPLDSSNPNLLVHRNWFVTSRDQTTITLEKTEPDDVHVRDDKPRCVLGACYIHFEH